MDLKTELQQILAEVGPDNVWRPIFDENDEKLSDGIADMRDGHPVFMDRVDFRGRTVADLGCNFGYYSFLARQRGASRVVGVDSHQQVVRGAGILAEMRGVEGVEFIHRDFLEEEMPGRFDVSMLINFIGRNLTLKGVDPLLQTVEGFTTECMVICARQSYRIEKHLKGDYETLHRLYPDKYFYHGYLHVADYVTDYLAPRWDMSVISPQDWELDSVKQTLLFVRK